MKLKKFIYKLTHLEIRRKLFFPNSKISPLSKDKNIDNYDKKDFFNLSNTIIKPFLTEKGFKGENDIYVKEFENYFNRIVIGSSKNGKTFCLNCEIKKKNLDNYEIFKIDSFPTNFDFWKRLSPDKLDNWWFTGDSKEKNIKILSEMIRLIDFEGFIFFDINNKNLL